jgi:immunoglobulin-like protein involved in spore germination/sporulation and spore germination protein
MVISIGRRAAMMVAPVAALATAIALMAAAGCGTAPTATKPGSPASAPPATMTVKAYFHKGPAGDPQRVAGVTRTVPRSSAVVTTAVRQLLAGPSAAERGSGYWSFFSQRTAHMLRGISLTNGVARVDFRDFSRVIPNASSSFGSAALLAELDATVKQFPGVRSAVYSFNGDAGSFYEWLQLQPPGSTQSTAGAVAQARGFLREIAGMTGLIAGAARVVSGGLVEVDLRSDGGTGPVTTVTLQRQASQWVPAGARTPALRLDAPVPGGLITAPVTIAGRSVTFEAQFSATIRQSGSGQYPVLGRNNAMMGGSTGMAPFHGQVSFRQPADAGAGWVVLTYQSAKTGATAGATAVPVRFAARAPAPRIGGVRVTSGQPVKAGWLTLAGSGTVTFAVQTAGADRVRLYLTPTGTGTASLRKLIGAGAPANGVFTFTWQYPDQPQMAHLTVVATGPGGRAGQTPFNVVHP